MKKVFCIVLFVLSVVSFAQDKNVIVNGRMFTVNERVNIQLKYDERIPELQLSDDQLYEYSTIVDDNFYYMIVYNKKKDKTKAEIKAYFDKRVAIQNKELKKILSPEQFKTHLEIYQTLIMTPLLNRLNSYEPQ